jgi:hypothetical protein
MRGSKALTEEFAANATAGCFHCDDDLGNHVNLAIKVTHVLLCDTYDTVRGG